MKYKNLLKILKVLMYIKRFLWWLGSHFAFVIQIFFLRLLRAKAHISYRANYRFKKLGFVVGNDWYTKRVMLHGAALAILFAIALPQSRWWSVPYFGVPGQHTRLYALVRRCNRLRRVCSRTR
jgi:hypothetical protein